MVGASATEEVEWLVQVQLKRIDILQTLFSFYDGKPKQQQQQAQIQFGNQEEAFSRQPFTHVNSLDLHVTSLSILSLSLSHTLYFTPKLQSTTKLVPSPLSILFFFQLYPPTSTSLIEFYLLI